MKLGDSSCLAGLEVLQIEATDQVIVTKDVLRDEIHFVVVVNFTALLWPVSVAQVEAILPESGKEDDGDTTLLPNHLPKVCLSTREDTLSDTKRKHQLPSE